MFEMSDWPGVGDEFERMFPVLEQLCAIYVPLANVHVVKHAREKVVNLLCYVQDVSDSLMKKKYVEI